MGQIATPTFDPKTRVGGEFFLYYNLGAALNFGSVSMGSDGTTVNSVSNAGCQQLTPAASGVYVVRARTPINASGPVSVAGFGITATIPAKAAIGTAVEASGTYNANAAPSAGGAAAGDAFDIMQLPAPSADVLVCYDQGVNIETGEAYRAIGRKFNPVDHWVRQRLQNQISVKELYVCNKKGLAAIAQRDCVLIGKFFPDGGAVPSEIYYWTRCRLTYSLSTPEDANESVVDNLQGMFAEYLSFCADPTF